MFAARQDQENVVERRRGVATHKSHGVKSLPKTPARKTASVRNHSDENQAEQTRLTIGKQKSQAFVTPTERTIRAPLGAKATNGKALLLKTPSQPVHDARPLPSTTIKRTRRTQFKVHQPPETNKHKAEDETRDIEYMPPRGEPLPDLPDDDIWPHDRTYEQLEGDNFTKGWSWYIKSLDADSDFEEEYREALFRESQIERSKLNSSQVIELESHLASASKSRPLAARTSRGFAAATKASTARSKSYTSSAGTGYRQPKHTVLRRAQLVGDGTAPHVLEADHESSMDHHHGAHRAELATSLHGYSDWQTQSDDANTDEFSGSNKSQDLLELEGLYALDLLDD